ncbi:MAG: glycosyltransferase family 39 protein [Nitrospirae bacterium]|nr:glycosyltransferase family 39 protein [Nitrospirota bacterium]
MKNYFLDQIPKFLKWVLLAGAVSYAALYLIVVFFRIRYPFELIWLEGAYVDHVNRILSGYKYYVKPSIEFVPSIYTPLFFYLSALLSRIIGIGFLPLRLISFTSSLGSFLIIYLMVKRESGDKYSGLIASCLFYATFYLTGSHFDIGRVDSLFLFLLLTSLYIVRFNESEKYYFIAGAVISLAFLTKQTALVISLPIMVYCIFFNKRLALSFIAPIVLIVGFGSFFLNYYYDGWFNFYVFELPRTTPVDNKVLLSFWPKDIIMPVGIAFSIGIFYLFSLLTESKRKIFFFYFLALLGTVTASWYSRYRIGFTNVLFPTYAFISILFGLGLNKLLEISQTISFDKRSLMKTLIYLVCIVQFCSASLVYNPLTQIPTSRDLEAGKELIKQLSQIKGEIFVFNHGYISVLAGKKSYANIMGARDVYFTTNEKHADIKAQMLDDIEKTMRERKFGAVILDSVETCGLPGFRKYYTLSEKIFKDEEVFFPVTGTRTRPDLIYTPNNYNSSKINH